jgi:hypothetical protein
MASAFGEPVPLDRGEVADVVGEQGSRLVSADGEQRLVVLSLPSPLDDGDHVVARVPKALGDQWRVVMVEGQLHRSARCWRSQRARSAAAARFASSASASTSSRNSE